MMKLSYHGVSTVLPTTRFGTASVGCIKYNFDLHVLESKAQDAEDRLETVASQAQKMADIVTEQWIQIQRLEQAPHIIQVFGFRFFIC
ncbi:unnamed protein product [Prunus armeniaca]